MIIATSAPGAWQIAVNEMSMPGLCAKLLKRISPGVCLFDADAPAFFRKSQKNPPIFIRHIMPVDLCFKNRSDAGIVQSLTPLFDRLTGGAFSVQARVFNCADLSGRHLAALTADYLTSRGFRQNVKNPEEIISIAADSDVIYAGLSSPGFNMSKFSGGAPVFAKDAGFISRAEFKLLEAAAVFGISFTPGQNALDLGASPGGWSKVLLSLGLNVTAVDPAELSESLKGRVRHVKSSAQRFFKDYRGASAKFDVITNDMKMDIDAAIDILFEAKDFLSENGIIITSLKLPEKGQQKIAYRAAGVLETKFRVLNRRQLFYNRNEICAVCGTVLRR